MVCLYCNPNYGEGHTTHTNHAQVQAPQEIAELLLLLLHKLYFMLSVSMEQFHYEPNALSRQYFHWTSPASSKHHTPVAIPHPKKGFSDPGKQTWSRVTWHIIRGSMVSFVTRLTQHIRECSLSLS